MHKCTENIHFYHALDFSSFDSEILSPTAIHVLPGEIHAIEKGAMILTLASEVALLHDRQSDAHNLISSLSHSL